MNSTINCIGIYIPEKTVTNQYFEKILDTNDEWIQSRSGVVERHYAEVNEYTSDLCVKAVNNLVENYHKDLSDVDFIIVATSTPDQILPNVASQIQARLNIPSAGCIDLYAACAGFVYGIIMAKGLIAAGTHKKILIIGAETLSKVTNFSDRSSCILFGDGAGAVIVEQSAENHIHKAVTHTDGTYGKDLYLSFQPAPINGEKIIADHKLHQNGRAVFKWAVTTLTEKLQELAKLNHLTIEEIDWLVPHSANIRILSAVCDNLGLSLDKCLEGIRYYGNTSAASVPLAWYNGLKDGKIKIGDKLMLVGFGGGLTCAGIYLENQIKNPQ